MTATRPPGYDDRSAAPVEASRRGAHRARPKPIAAILPVLAGVVVVLLVIGAVYTVIGSKSDSPAKNSAAEKALEDEANSTANPESSAKATKGGKASSDASPSADGSAGSGGAGGGSKVDKTIPVRVLNSIAVSGLAHTYADKIAAKGWTIDGTDNSTNKDLPTTKIYYQDADMKPSANAVRKALGGIGEITQDADVNPGKITVVLGQDAA